MSYTIEYDKVFLMTGEGIVPCWLCGDSNVTTGSGKYERRYRSWSIFCNMLGVTRRELEAKAESLCGSSEHWKKGSRWVDDDGLRRWIKSGCNNAYRIEDVLQANGLRSYSCYVRTWYESSCKTELQAYVHNTEELNSWIRLAKAYISDMRCEGHDVFPIIQFSYDEPIKKPASKNMEQLLDNNTGRKFLIKRGRSYLVKFEEGTRGGSSVSWTYKPEDAVPWDAEAIKKFMDPIGPYRSLNKGCKLVKAESVLDAPWNACIKALYNGGGFAYISKVNSRSLSLSYSVRCAKHYKDMASAEAAVARLRKRSFDRVCDYEIVIDPDAKPNKANSQI